MKANDTYRSEVIAVLGVERRVTLQPSMTVRDDDFCVRVRWQRLYLASGSAGEMDDRFERGEVISEIGNTTYLVTRKSNQPFHEKLSVFLR